MFQYSMPEEKGISSRDIKQYVELLEQNRLSTHDIIITKGNHIVFENYWAPFHENFLHRMYSVSKSFVSLAVGCCEQDGLLSLDDKIEKYFPEEMKAQADENFRNQTIRHMLMMSTSMTPKDWFAAKPDDRVKFYFENDRISRPSGMIFEYDSPGSFVLCAMVERLTGMPFLDYLRVKFLDEIGFSKEATCLQCPGGHSWGDSAILCTAQDLLKVARFVMNGGNWNGRQLLNQNYIQQATGYRIDNNVRGINTYNTQGYGYYFWRTYQNSYYFSGLGCQFAVCVPEKDLILIYNGDNQGNEGAEALVIDNFFHFIVNRTSDEEISPNQEHVKELSDYVSDLKLMTAVGEKYSEWQSRINGKHYKMDDNLMGITSLRLVFAENEGRLEYSNDQGAKVITFGMCENRFGFFPQEGYADQFATVATKDFYYKCAASAAWIEPHKLFLKIQIIDNYFGNLNIVMSFRDQKVGIYMNKSAEDFLGEYRGYATGSCTP